MNNCVSAVFSCAIFWSIFYTFCISRNLENTLQKVKKYNFTLTVSRTILIKLKTTYNSRLIPAICSIFNQAGCSQGGSQKVNQYPILVTNFVSFLTENLLSFTGFLSTFIMRTRHRYLSF